MTSHAVGCSGSAMFWMQDPASSPSHTRNPTSSFSTQQKYSGPAERKKSQSKLHTLSSFNTFTTLLNIGDILTLVRRS